MQRAHTHPDIEMNCILAGRVEYVLAGRRVVLSGGQVGIFWGGTPHQLISCDGVEGSIWLTLPLKWFLRCGFSNGFAAKLMTGQLQTLSLPIERAQQWLADFDAGDARRRLVLLELEALFERIALTTPLRSRAKAQHRSETSTPMELITEYLSRHYQELLSIDDIAAEFDLHPKYLMTVFRRSAGITIKSYLLRLRLAHAQRLLATTRRSILDIAMESGFGSLGRFYDAFAKHIGERPLQYRKRHAE
jgi:AraC-like DNA-binding protein